MSEETVRFRADPNRLLAEGDEGIDAPAMSFEVGDDGLRLTARTGTLTKRTFEFAYPDVTSVGYDEGLTYDFVFEAGGTTYQVTNVTADRSEIRDVVAFVRDRRGAARRRERAADASAADASADADAGATADGSGATADVAEQLREWAALRDEGIITDEEFEAKKRDLLG
jgi:hypothetical protein